MTALLTVAAAWLLGAPDVERIVRENEAAVLVIVGERQATGAQVQSSGCIVHPDGLVITTAHQIAGVHELSGRLQDGTTIPLSPLVVNAREELALLRANAPGPYAVARIGSTAGLRSGSSLVAIATPLSLDFTTVTGIVSSTKRTYRGYPVLQTELSASPGSSGGPVFDKHGSLVGLIIGRPEGLEWVTLVNPIDNAFPLLREHGVISAGPAVLHDGEVEVVPAAGIRPNELRAINLYNRGVRAKDPVAKAAAYREATTLLPGFFEAWFNLGVALSLRGELDSAAVAYKTAAEIRPVVPVRRNLGLLHLRAGKLDAALAQFQAALDTAPQSPQILNDLGETYRRMNRLEKAAQSLEQALKQDANYAQARYNLGLTRAMMGDAEGAIQQFETYLELRPDASDVAEVRAWIAKLAKDAGANP